MSNIKVLSLGGSIVAPEQADAPFIKLFRQTVLDWLNEEEDRKIILVTGGGGPARIFQKAYRDVVDNPIDELQDWIGIAATRLNAELIKSVFESECKTPVVTDPTAEFDFSGRVLVAAGWKPGFSTDFDAVLLAERFGANTVVNLSNIAKVFTDDPKTNPKAKPLDEVTWKSFRNIVGEEWVPGKNVPFDPIATKKAAELKLKVIVAAGREIENLKAILRDQECEGTIIGPQ